MKRALNLEFRKEIRVGKCMTLLVEAKELIRHLCYGWENHKQISRARFDGLVHNVLVVCRCFQQWSVERSHTCRPEVTKNDS